jgi:hypothetical protein
MNHEPFGDMKRRPAAVGFATIPPFSNTGVNYQAHLETTIDTLSGVFRNVPALNDAYGIIDCFERLFDDRVALFPDRAITNGRKWDGHSSGSLRGLKFYWQKPAFSKPGQLCVYASGRCLSRVSQEETKALFQKLNWLYEFDCTRIDVALDDYSKIVGFEEIKHAIKNNNITGAQKFRFIESFEKDADELGVTIYMGSTSSDKMLRMYDKSVESKGEKDCYRWEAQFRRFKANVVFYHWVSPNCEQDYLSSVVVGCVDFVDRSSGDHHVDRLPRLPWWEEFLFFVGQGTKIPCKKVVASLQKVVDWIGHSVAPSLMRIFATHPEEFMPWLQCSMDEAFERFTSSDIAKMQIYQSEVLLF